MAKPKFDVSLSQYHEITEIEGAWAARDYGDLIQAMDGNHDEAMSETERAEFCLMCLQDREPEKAAEFVLRQKLGQRLTKGQIETIAMELPDEKFWEHYADLSMHQSLFHVGSLLYKAFPQVYNRPDAVQLTCLIQATNHPAKEILAAPLNESLVLRILADGMDSRSILHRLFDDKLAGTSFPESAMIVWDMQSNRIDDDQVEVTVISSHHWLHWLKDVQTYESSAEPDAIETDD